MIQNCFIARLRKLTRVSCLFSLFLGRIFFFCRPYPSDGFPTLTSKIQAETEAVLLKHIPDPSFNNELPTPTLTLQKKAHMQYLIRNLRHGFPTRYMSQDASQPWLTFWTVQSFAILRVSLILIQNKSESSYLNFVSNIWEYCTNRFRLCKKIKLELEE